MSGPRPWLAHATDPLPQLLSEHPSLDGAGGLIAASQVAALADWQSIERWPGEVSIVLRRIGQEEPAEWRDGLAILLRLISGSRKDVRLLALNPAAADFLARETGLPVAALPDLPRRYAGACRLTLSRAEGPLQILRIEAGPLPARQYNLARLRRMAVIDAAPGDPDLSDLAAHANGVAGADAGDGARAPVVVVVVPNGIGLGHVTRMLAVARHLRQDRGARVVFWSFSRAAGIISRFGFETVLRQTAQHLGAETGDWLKWETEEFAALLRGLKPDLVVQDSSALQRFVVDALARPGSGAARLALIRRGMWQASVLGTEALASEELADLVLEPGDLASEADRGVTRGRSANRTGFARMAVSAPVTLTGRDEVLDRRSARRALGLGRGRLCLVSLGGEAIGDWNLLARNLVAAADRARIGLVWARSPLAAPDPMLGLRPDIVTRSVYPLAPCLAAFDGVVSSVGYNSFHELMQLYDGPVLFVPGRHSRLDDQAARAQFAASRGWATHLAEGGAQHDVLSAFMADVRAARRVPARPEWRNGASEVAGALGDLLGAGG
ncbi:hypothetical protein N8I71_04520 [Roseibacterium sp. SDUM158016]|uniref:hypothetical protein n=1 Tax=Roseicyclus sediminis TaxID=2980997 RepID=UPI0021CE3C57|nr:hypothetical protein [Roseibacterium sp. SDUM158016]MCU4652080.1 hypothetical protein [Roseibacterium sp. SDUM158016]